MVVTGADGFIGSHLAERLVEDGADVAAFCFYNSDGSCGLLTDLVERRPGNLKVCLGDIRDARAVEEALAGAEVVFHLAALVAIPYSYRAPESFVDTNVRGTMNVLEAVRRNGCKRLVAASTSEVYGTPDSLPIRETHALKAQSPYAATKIAADKLCEAFACSFGTPVVIVRPFNTYGPRQSTRAVVPTILTQLLRGADEVALGSLEPRRDLTFVTDTVDGFVRAGSADGLEPGEVIQLGTGVAHSVREIFDACCRAVRKPARIVQTEERKRPAASEVAVLQSDPDRARRRLGWSAGISLETGLGLTVEWMRGRIDQYTAGGFHF